MAFRNCSNIEFKRPKRENIDLIDFSFCIIPSEKWIVQGAAVWTPTILKVNDKGVVGVGRHGRWQQFGRIF